MPIYVVVAALAVVVSVPLLWASLAIGRVPGGRISRNLTAGFTSGSDARRLVLSRSPVERVVQPVVELLAGRARKLTPSGLTSSIERQLEISGVRWPIERVLAAKLALGMLALAAASCGSAYLAPRRWRTSWLIPTSPSCASLSMP
jgi:hypothetical protein